MHDLFEAVRHAVLALGPQVREEFLRNHVAYKTHTNFVDLVPQKRRLLLTLNRRSRRATEAIRRQRDAGGRTG